MQMGFVQSKMSCNNDSSQQTHEVSFSRKIHQTNHLPLLFNHNFVNSASTKNHLGMELDAKLESKIYL